MVWRQEPFGQAVFYLEVEYVKQVKNGCLDRKRRELHLPRAFLPLARDPWAPQSPEWKPADIITKSLPAVTVYGLSLSLYGAVCGREGTACVNSLGSGTEQGSWGSWAQKPFCAFHFLFLGTEPHSASLIFPEFQGARSDKLLIGKEGRRDQGGALTQATTVQPWGRVLVPPQGLYII